VRSGPARRLVVVVAVGLVATAAALWLRSGGSPDGAVTFARSSGRAIDLFTVTLADGRLQRHTEGPGTSASPAWSPDGTTLAFARRVGPPYNLWLLDAADGGLRRLTRGTAIDGHPTWSPDGARVAFASNRGPGAGFFIHLIAADGSGLRRLVAGRSPAWSPRGDVIAFERDGDLFAADAATGEERPLTTGAPVDTTPAWSPAGDAVVFARTGDGDGGLHVLRVDDGEVRRLTDVTSDAAPAWSPDGRWVVFARADAEGSDLYVVPISGRGEQRVTSSPLSDGAPTWRPTPPPR